MSDTITVQRQAAIRRPKTANPEARTLEVVIATDRDVGDGVRLDLSRLPEHGPVVPVLLDHTNRAASMAGRLLDLRIENGALVGTAEFRDAPASEEGWTLARSGIGVSVGASYRLADLRPGPGGVDIASPWTLREASLTPVPADLAAVTRSAPLPAPSTPFQTMDNNDTQTTQAAEAQDTATIKAERAQQKLELTIRRAAQQAGLSVDETQEIIDTHRGRTETDALTAVVRAMRIRTEAAAPAYAGHPARGMDWPRTGAEQPRQSELETAITRALSGKALDRPLVQVLRDAGYTGRSAADVVRAAFTGQRPESWLSRGFHSTSDAKDLLLSTGDRRLQERFAEPPRGILSLARTRELADFREASILDVGLVGGSSRILEGGEIQFRSLADSAGSYKPSRYGLGLAFSFESLANDDLGGLDAVLLETSATMVEAEADALTALLTADTDGAEAPDGVQLFDAAHNNSTAAAMDINGLAAAVLLLREQTSIGGRRLYLNPGTVLVGPELETQAAQLLAETWAADVPENVNPWRLNLVVEPSLEGETWYLFSDGPRRPFELGRVAGMPRMMQEEHFDTSSMRMKIEHAFGCAVADHRVVVRCTQPQG